MHDPTYSDLVNTFKAIAGRFRPEDATEWGYGRRGGVSAANAPLKPFHRRFPTQDEELIYGHRGDFMQAKAYLKRTDQRRALPPAEHRVRMEVSLRRAALMDDAFNLRNLEDLLGFPYRRIFAQHFRMIERPEVRSRKGLSKETRTKLEKQMLRAWKTAGVGKFAPSSVLPPETSKSSAQQIAKRALEQLPRNHFVLKRDQVSNGKIGAALQQLQRQMPPLKIRAVRGSAIKGKSLIGNQLLPRVTSLG